MALTCTDMFTEEVLAEVLGYDDARMVELRTEDVIG